MSHPNAAPEGARYLVAGFWRRAVAALVDGVLLLPLVLVFGGATALLSGRALPRVGELGLGYLVRLAVDDGISGVVALAAGAFVVLLYLLLFLATSGRTLGLRLLGLRVIDAYGDAPSLPRAFVRVVGLVLSFALFCLGCIWIAFSREKRGLHDLIAGTWVVRAEPVFTPPRPMTRAVRAPSP